MVACSTMPDTISDSNHRNMPSQPHTGLAGGPPKSPKAAHRKARRRPTEQPEGGPPKSPKAAHRKARRRPTEKPEGGEQQADERNQLQYQRENIHGQGPLGQTLRVALDAQRVRE